MRAHAKKPVASVSPLGEGPFSVLAQVESAQEPLRVPQLARIYGVSAKTIYKAIAKGKIPVMDLGMDVVRVDPKTLAHQLRHNNPAMRIAARS